MRELSDQDFSHCKIMWFSEFFNSRLSLINPTSLLLQSFICMSNKCVKCRHELRDELRLN